jgi:signal transduction histidine kinase
MITVDLANLLMAGSLLTIVLISLVLAYKMRAIKQLQATIAGLRASLDEMDEQAKLIVRTDMELNKTQEELDKKVTGLYALQRLSRAISTTLQENQIFQMIRPEYLEDMELQKASAFIWNAKESRFLLKLNIGYTTEEMGEIKAGLEQDRNPYLGLIGNEQAVSSVLASIDLEFKGKINRLFKVQAFILCPILPKEGDKGFLFVGTDSQDTLLSEADEELILILANQIGQALENARLFEKIWHAQQDLEKKVDERTQELTRALEEVKIISKRKTDFISSVSHELRTPLTSVKGYASILLGGTLGNIPPAVRERLEKINHHSDELVHMVNDLLDIARIESGRVAMKTEPLQLKSIVAAVVDLLSLQLKERHLNLTSHIPDQADNISADKTQISRVFINLIGNALKFTPAQGQITVSASRHENLVQIDVSDSGCGIPPEAQEKIFEEFYRVDNPINQQLKGTGLGLSLVKHIVEAHHGTIWVKSKLGAGSTFSFTLPAI